MSTGLYTHRTRNAGEIVRDTLYNPAHKNHQINDVPNMAGALSDDTTEFQTVLDPAPGNVPVPVLDVASEFQQLRFAIADIKTALNNGTPVAWYEPVTPLALAQRGRGARVYRSTSQAIPLGTRTAITFDTIRYDTGVTDPLVDPFFVIGSPTKLTAKTAGLYQLNGFVEWIAGTDADLAVALRLNGTTLLAIEQYDNIGAVSSGVAWQPVSSQYLLATNDYVELIVFQLDSNPLTLVFADFGLELLNPTTVIAPPTSFLLAVDGIGTGSGVITSDVGGINCPGACNAIFADGTVVVLTATPTVGGFVEWSGDVPVGHETDNPLTVTMDQVRTLHARFTAVALNIVEAGTGAGVVTSDIGGINCPGTCSALYAIGDVVTLTATPTAGAFVDWSGDIDAGQELLNPGVVTMDADKTVTVDFALTGVLFAFASGGTANLLNTTYIAPTSTLVVNATLANAQFKLSIDVEIVGISATMVSALAGGHTLSLQYNIGGVDDATIVALLIAGNIEGEASGVIVVPADTLITIKAVQSGGGGDNIQSLTVLYRPV